MGRVTGPPRKPSLLEELKLRAIVGAGRLVNLLLVSTYRVSRKGRTCAQRRRAGEGTHYGVYALWHRDIWNLTRHMSHEEMVVLASEHGDAELAVRLLAGLGYDSVRGSSTRGGVRGLLKMVRAVQERRLDLVFTVDGPRGPAQQVKPGVVFAASRAGLPVIPLGVAVDRSWALRSWDGHRIAKPFAKVALVIGEEIHVPDDASQEELATRWTEAVQAALQRVEEEARRELAARG
jgi:lysophospholipid acyltransferase (LPLAT)-like uncharacterized protein